MAHKPFLGKERIGRITIERYQDRYIRLRWTLQGKTYSINIGNDSRETIKAARAKAQLIDSDITFNQFDTTLRRYGKESKSTILSIVPSDAAKSEISLKELWSKFLDDKLPHIKKRTADEYNNFTRLLDKLEKSNKSGLSYDGLQVKQNLLSITTVDQTKRMLTYLSAVCNWGIKHGLIHKNPFLGLASELPKRKSDDNPNPDAFTEAEMEAVINAFRNDSRPGMNYRHYAPIVEFWFLTGCRPSEGIGLTWDCLNDDCSQVTFKGSIQTIRGRQQWSEGSKNNKIRTIAVSKRTQELLLSIRPEKYKPDGWVFPSPKGQAINYPNFQSKIWHLIVEPIKPNTTPYNCRDTFVTNQLCKGVSSAIVAKWCDTSTKMIDQKYADRLKLSQIRPLD
jgi:integrase